MRTLKWVTYAKRPLRAAELQHGISVNPESKDIDENDLIEVPRLISFCGGILAFEEESGLVRLVHYTTQKYLETYFRSMDANAEIGITCLRYLSFSIFSRPWEHSVDGQDHVYFQRVEQFEKYALSDYAALFWGAHLRCDSEEQFHPLIFDTFQLQTTRDTSFALATGYVNYVPPARCGPPNCTFLHLAAFHNLPKLCLSILRKKIKFRRYFSLYYYLLTRT